MVVEIVLTKQCAIEVVPAAMHEGCSSGLERISSSYVVRAKSGMTVLLPDKHSLIFNREAQVVAWYGPDSVIEVCPLVGINAIHYPLFREPPSHKCTTDPHQEDVTGEGQGLRLHTCVDELGRRL